MSSKSRKSSSSTTEIISSADRWSLFESLVNELGLVRQHLDSFDDFIENQLNNIVAEIGKIEPDIENYYVKLIAIETEKPSIREADGSERAIYPSEARIRNLIYSIPLYLVMKPVVIENDIEEEKPIVKAYIGRIPLMLKSKLCPLAKKTADELVDLGEDPTDPGGYFIINGSERVIVTQEYLVSNRVLVDYGRKGGPVTASAKIFSTVAGFRSLVTVERRSDRKLTVNFFSVPRPLPFGVLMKSLGIKSDAEIASLISDREDILTEFTPTLLQSHEVLDQDEALDFIGKRVAVGQTQQYRVIRAKFVLDHYLLPHLGTKEEDRKSKALFLAQMALRVLEIEYFDKEPDDKDHYANKRLKLAGEMLTSLFRVAFKSLYKDIKYQLEKNSKKGKLPNLRVAMRADVITERVRHALATGNWVGGKAGVSQLLDRTNYMSTYSNLRRVISPLIRSQAHFEARDLHATHWGKICPNETPEGPNCGLVKNLALQAYISAGTDSREIINFIHSFSSVRKIDNEFLNQDSFSGTQIDHSAVKIFVDGILVGTTQERNSDGLPKVFEDLKKARRENKVSNEINMAYYPDDLNGLISINTDDGRVRRPLLICKDGRPLIKKEHIEKLKNGDRTWRDLVEKDGVIEYLDAEEEENAYIALYPKDLTPDHTHLEISPATILGIATSTIPFAQHNQSPRNTYEAGMIKQALGLYASNFKYRADRRGHILQNPQKPLVGGKVLDLIGFNSRPCGQNAIVGVISFQGWNIQDAIVFNKASIQRGLFRSHFFRSYIAEEKKYLGGQEDKFEIPTKGVRGFRAQEVYRHLSEVDGIIEPEIEVSGGDVLVGRTSRPRFLEEYIELEQPEPQRRETSTSMRHGESGVIDTVIITETSEGNKLVKVKVRDQRIPELGDKFASRHGQKGVIGAILPQEDLPFTEDGIVPDLIINPHAIPNRMTIGQVLEGMAALIASIGGSQFDATLFESPHPDEIAKTLLKYGFHPYAETTMYDGITGRLMPSKIYITPIYYQKLHHLVADKIHARARGPVQILTRQPTEGRAREGGLRFGEMERDCIIGHGAALLLKERLLDESDKIEIYICERCGLIADHNNRTGQTQCKVCGTQDTSISKIAVSYAFKLLMQELVSMTIKPSLILETTS
jgi:DNA-directed RNA polymerase subunit B